jgi:hypothetical protein
LIANMMAVKFYHQQQCLIGGQPTAEAEQIKAPLLHTQV